MIRYPKLNRAGVNRVGIPSLDGGINTKDNATLINDNQLVDAKNVWFDGQTLKTRPKVIKTREYEMRDVYYKKLVKTFDIDFAGVDYKIDIEVMQRTKYEPTILRVLAYNLLTGVVSSCNVDLCENYSKNYIIKVNAYCGEVKNDTDLGVYVLVDYNHSAILPKGRYYPKKILKVCMENSDLSVVELFHFNEDNEVITDELYKPLIYINGKGEKYSYLPITAETEYAPASVFEGANLLQSGMRFQFMTDSISSKFYLPIKNLNNKFSISLNVSGTGIKFYTPDGEEANNLLINNETKDGYYSFENEYISDGENKKYNPVSLYLEDHYTKTTDTKFKKKKKYYYRNEQGYTVEITDAELKGTLISEYDNDVYEYTDEISYVKKQVVYSNTNLYVTFDAKNGVFSFGDGNEETPLVLPMTIVNNIEITVYKYDFSQFNALMDMNLCTLYGGGQGVFGGTRTFLAGYKNKICFSNSEEPTYFSENNYISVGDNSQITALGKMEDALVIFKKNSIYCTKSYSGDAVTAEQIQSGQVVDVSTTYAYFPIFQLTDEYGCDLPNTVKLCLNRLVFANSDGNVYCLVTQSNSSQRNVYCISGGIRRKMFNENNICLLDSNAFAVNWGDYYLLFCNNKVWALNYNKDSYRYVYSYTNRTNNSSSRYFTWWYWELGNAVMGCGLINQKLFLVNYREEIYKEANDNGEYTAFIDRYNHYTDIYEMCFAESEPNCECYIKTKVFDLGAADRYKKIEKLSIGVGNDIPADIMLTVETDKGVVYNRPIGIDCNEEKSRFSAQYGSITRVIPYCNKVKQFAIILETNGVMSIEKLYIYYKMFSEVIE